MTSKRVRFEERFSLCWWGQVLCACWGRDTLIADLDLLHDESERGRLEFGRFGTITVLRAPLQLGLDPAIRRRSEAIARDAAEFSFGGAVVIEQTGFRATALRSAITGIGLVSRSPSPTRSFDSIAEACGWIASLSPDPLDPTELDALVTAQADAVSEPEV